MPKRLTITLNEEQRAELLEARDHHAKAYVREKAAAILNRPLLAPTLLTRRTR